VTPDSSNLTKYNMMIIQYAKWSLFRASINTLIKGNYHGNQSI
jgi:hypothetical protein